MTGCSVDLLLTSSYGLTKHRRPRLRTVRLLLALMEKVSRSVKVLIASAGNTHARFHWSMFKIVRWPARV